MNTARPSTSPALSDAERRGANGRRLTSALLALSLVAADLHSCASTHEARRPVAEPAALAIAEAEAARREGANGWKERVRSSCRRALDAEPGWVVPQRMLDDLEREDLLTIRRLAESVERLEDDELEDGARARELYLVGRLEGAPGAARFERAAEFDPSFAWAYHGLAWRSLVDGNAHRARQLGREAFALARSENERAYFANALARYELALGHNEDAAERLERLLDDGTLSGVYRPEAAVRAVRARLDGDEVESIERGYWRGLALLETEKLTAGELRELVGALRTTVRSGVVGSSDAIDAALVRGAANDTPGTPAAVTREQLRVESLFGDGYPSYVLGLRDASSDKNALQLSPPAAQRALRLSAGELDAIDDWLRALPRQVLDADGSPARAELRAVVDAARAKDVAALGEALLEAGWYREARGLAAHVARTDPARALALDGRAVRALATLEALRDLFLRIDARRAYVGPLAGVEPGDGAGSDLDTLEELLAAFEPELERYFETDLDVVGSPERSVAGVGTLVHPGPFYSSADEAAGLGKAGDPVPGLAAAMHAMGRFAIVGDALGQDPDGTIRRVVAVDTLAGEHLGVPFAGTRVWCEGGEVVSRPERRGANLLGAALHEGYWIDVQGIGDELELWRAIERRFEDPERARAALEVVGPRVPADAGEGARRQVLAADDEANRMRLALFVERGPIAFEELIDATARHEEGHLTDHTRFLPVLSKPLRALGLFFESGLTPDGVARRLEYRAELIALCVAEDPRVALTDVLSVGDTGGSGTPHASAYRGLLRDWLEVLDGMLDELPALDRERYLVHQLHRLSADEVRRVSLALAKREGLRED